MATQTNISSDSRLESRITVLTGNIVEFESDVIVNAANSALSGGGGVDGAIHRAAGPDLLAECRALGRCPIGSAVLTKAYDLPARYLIHAVGPAWDGGHRGELELLASCYRRALELAVEVRASSLAFPAIGCGAYRFPVDAAARVALNEVAAFLTGSPEPGRVTFVCFDVRTAQRFEQARHESIRGVTRQAAH